MFDAQIEDIKSSRVETKELELLKNQPTVGSLSATDRFSSDEMRRFLLHSRNIKKSVITGCEAFSDEILRPYSNNILLSNKMLDRMVEYYEAAYENQDFRFGEGSESAVIIRVKMNQLGRCRISSEVFGSSMSLRYVKSLYILAKFITSDGNVDCYPGQVQYYFSHTINLPNGPTEHFLAYVRWYQPTDSLDVRYHFSDDEQTYNVELWGTEFYPESHDCIILLHHILGQFVSVNYRISIRRNAREYLAINPINRKYHI